MTQTKPRLASRPQPTRISTNPGLKTVKMFRQGKRKLALPFRWQEKKLWCGPACLQMVVGSYGLRIPQSKLAKLARTNNRFGTSRFRMAVTARRLGMATLEKHNSRLEDIRRALANKQRVIVNFREPSDNEQHYAGVESINKSQIILRDPWNGPRLKLAIKDFYRRWTIQTLNGGKPRWLLSIYPTKKYER